MSGFANRSQDQRVGMFAIRFPCAALALLLPLALLLVAPPARAGVGFDPAPSGKPGMRFAEYTYALIWEPGACLTRDALAGPDCATRTPRDVRSRQFSLHGLWASTPAELQAQQMPDPVWWRYGCYWYRPGHAIPAGFCSNAALDLPAALQARLWRAMPAAQRCLDRHEYFKHAQCFGFRPAPFFGRALDMLDAVNASAFTAWIRAHAGQTVSRGAVRAAFRRGFGPDSRHALELRCGRRPGAAQADVLVQAWMTVRAGRLARFPAPDSFGHGRRGNCPARIFIAR